METGLAQIGADDESTLLSADETIARQVTSGGVYQRMWDYLTHGDPELTVG